MGEDADQSHLVCLGDLRRRVRADESLLESGNVQHEPIRAVVASLRNWYTELILSQPKTSMTSISG